MKSATGQLSSTHRADDASPRGICFPRVLSVSPTREIKKRIEIFTFLASLFLSLAFLAACVGGGGGGSNSQQTPASSSYADQFDFLWQTFDRNYAFFVSKNIDWSALRDFYRPQAIQATSQDQFIQVLNAMLANLHDAHVVLIDPAGNYHPTFSPDAFVNFNNSVWQQYLQTKGTNVKQDDFYTSAELNGVAYIAVPSWQPSSGTETATLDSAMEQFRDAPAMIVDVRMNTGGDSTTAGNFAGRFADRTRTAGFVQYRDGPAHTDFGQLYSRQISPRGDWQFKSPVLLLIGRDCFSATEGFITQMRELPNVIVVGDTSAGHSSRPVTYNVSDGWKSTVSVWIDYTAEMQIIEDRGIDPAVFVPASAADFQAGRDPVLDYAISHFTN